MSRKELARLVAGFKRFRHKYFDGENSVYRKLSQAGQTPKTLIIGCSDSRVDPAILSSAEPGDLFVVRNVANLVPPYETNGGFHGVSSAIEFAVKSLKVENVVVLGHRQCGGIRALMTSENEGDSEFIHRWVNIAHEAREEVLRAMPRANVEQQCARCELESIRVSIRNLRSFPFVREAVEERGMNLIGAYFDIEEGRLLELDESKGTFSPLEA